MQMRHACRICQGNNFRVHFLAAIKQPNNLCASSLIARWKEARIRANTLFAYADALTFKYITCKMAERARQEADGMGEGGARTA